MVIPPTFVRHPRIYLLITPSQYLTGVLNDIRQKMPEFYMTFARIIFSHLCVRVGWGAKCPRPTVSYAYICNQKFYHKVKSLAPPYLPSSSSNWFLSHTPNRIHILCCFHEYLFHVNIQQKRTHMNILLKWQVGLFEPFFLNFAKTIFSTYANSFRTLLICVRDRGSLGQCKGMALHVRSYIGIAFAARIVKSKAV